MISFMNPRVKCADSQCGTHASGNWENTHLFSEESRCCVIFVHAECVSDKWRWSLPTFVIAEKKKTNPVSYVVWFYLANGTNVYVSVSA